MTAAVLAAAGVFPVLFTGLTAWAAAAGSVPWMLAAGLPAGVCWAVWAAIAAWVLPRPKRRAGWSAQEAAALDGGADLKRVLDAAPRKGRR